MKVKKNILTFGKRLFSRTSEDTSKKLAEQIANAPTIKVDLYNSNEQIGNVLKVEDVIEEFPKAYDEIILSPKAQKHIHGVTAPLSMEEKLSNEVLREYKEIFPPTTEVIPFSNCEVVTSSHIAGGESKMVTVLKERLKGWQVIIEETDDSFTFTQNHTKLSVDLKLGTIHGDEKLVNELKTFLGKKPINKENIQAFFEQRDLKYIQDNGIVTLSKIRKSVEKGREIEASERAYHNQRQKQYEQLWRKYPTETFYRIVGKEELLKALKGEIITSKNSIERYGHQCVDITTNPYYHEIMYGEPKYRITFKVKDEDGGFHECFTKGITEFKRETQHYQVPYYTKDDIADIKVWDGSSWKSI